MSLRTVFILLGIFHCLGSWGQTPDWKKKFVIKKSAISLVDIDNTGKILLSDNSGNLTQYDKNGDSINYYSPTIQGKLSQLEARRSLNIFTFSSDLQLFEILDRFLTPLSTTRFVDPNLGNIKAASLGNNQKLWLYDDTNLSLLQYDYQRNTILQRQALNLVLESPTLPVLEITEYQNTLFVNILDKGIYLFDNQANFIKHLPLKTEQKLCFYGNQLLTLSNGQLLITHYLTESQHSVDLPGNYEKVTAGNDVILFYNSRLIEGYTLPSYLLE
ncbi:hypothetical protein GCM10028791_10970 [Echinicola sediminis]